jgi:hypothetical protein
MTSTPEKEIKCENNWIRIMHLFVLSKIMSLNISLAQHCRPTVKIFQKQTKFGRKWNKTGIVRVIYINQLMRSDAGLSYTIGLPLEFRTFKARGEQSSQQLQQLKHTTMGRTVHSSNSAIIRKWGKWTLCHFQCWSTNRISRKVEKLLHQIDKFKK